MQKLWPPAAGLVGVDVGARCIKVAQLVRRKGVLALERAIVFERPPALACGANVSPDRFDAEGVRDALRGCENLSGRSAAAVLSMQACEYKTESIQAHLAEDEIARTARRLASRDSRLAGEVEHDYWISRSGLAGAREDSATLHVLSTPAPVAAALANAHRAAGFACRTIDGLPTALARAIRLGGHAGGGPVAAVDWGCSHVTICVVLRDRPVFVRSFARGTFSAIVASLCGQLNLTACEARQVLSSCGLPAEPDAPGASRTQRAIAASAAAALGEFHEELARTLSFLQGRQRALHPEKIVLFGAGATVANIAAHVRSASGMEAIVWQYPHVAVGPPGAARLPTALLGPAIALSALTWEQS